ncbi:CPBP family intramembrane glutamic endopeptidase [Chloroherpeton thalassium]|nr:type II CAAX endopeptidase family protein [Chloroherpeton thalassium]
MEQTRFSNAGFKESLYEKRLQLSLILTGVIWVSGLIGHFTPAGEWPALFIYVLGGIGIVLWHGKNTGEWKEMFISTENLGKSLKWGGIIGGFLFVMDVANTYMYLKGGGEPMAQMEEILVGMNMLYLFPLLILAEEFLWRGILFSALLEKGLNKHLVVAITTILYMVNHFAVAPVGLFERGLMAMMAMPIGIIGGYLVANTRNLWGSALIHTTTMVSMILDIFLIPKLVS